MLVKNSWEMSYKINGILSIYLNMSEVFMVPESWTSGPLSKGEGIKYVNPAKKGEQILLEKGVPEQKTHYILAHI